MSELKKLTRLGSDTKKIAALLQAKAPKGHMLAYINPREAALLKQHGGSGKPHADTGILSFADGTEGDYGFGGYDLGSTEDIAAADRIAQMPVEYSEPPVTAAPAVSGGQLPPVNMAGFQAGPDISFRGLTGAPVADQSAAETARLLRQEAVAATPSLRPAAAPPELEGEKPGLFGTMSDKEKRDLMLRAGLGLGQGLLGSRMATRAAAQGRAGAEQMQKVASPYQQMGQQIQAQAQRGELTPAGQQSLQALQARAAQAAESRGGVGAQQAQQQIEAFRQQLLQQQFDYGLKLSGIGDQIALGAIKTGMQADQYVNQLTSNYYNNIFRYLGGQPAAQQQQQPVTVGG